MFQESPCTCSLSLLGPPKHVWTIHFFVTSWFILSWILDSHGFCTCSCIKGTQEPSASQGFHFRSFMSQCGNYSSCTWINRKTVEERGQTESHRFYLQQPVAALAPLFFADPVGEIPERFEFLSARELLPGEFGWETTRPRTIVFLIFRELEPNFVEGWSRGWKVLFQKRSGIPNAHGIYSATCQWQAIHDDGMGCYWCSLFGCFLTRSIFKSDGYVQIKDPSGWKVSRDWSGIPRHLDIRFLPSLWRFLRVSDRLAEVLIAHGSRTRPSWGLTLEFFVLFCLIAFQQKNLRSNKRNN